MTKKIVSLFLAIAMMLMSIPALAENTEAVSIEPTLSVIMDRNTSEWLESDASRVLLTTCVLIDVLLSDYEQLSDVAANDEYAEAVAWAVAEGITDGTSDTTFSPAQTCTRGQIVTFLWRDLA